MLNTIIHENFKCTLSKKIRASVKVTQIIVTAFVSQIAKYLFFTIFFKALSSNLTHCQPH